VNLEFEAGFAKGNILMYSLNTGLLGNSLDGYCGDPSNSFLAFEVIFYSNILLA
jgi:hypothetical protein